jgi:hypothetical protein
MMCCDVSISCLPVMSAVKGVFLTYLAPEHHDQWEYAAQRCFQGETKIRQPPVPVAAKTLERRKARAETKNAEVLRRVAQLYLTLKEDGAPREHLLEVCSLVASTASGEQFNKTLRELHETDKYREQQRGAGVGVGGAIASSSSSSSSSTAAVPAALSGQVSTDSSLMPPPPPSNKCTELPSGFYSHAKLPNVTAKATESRMRTQEYVKRCKAYDSNPTVATAIRVVEEEGGSLSAGSSLTSALKKSSTISSIDEKVVTGRLGYRSAKAFCEQLDIMQKVIKTYRDATEDSEKESLLRLICGSFTREEVNKFVLPPAAHVLRPGKVRNMELISMHKWTEIRKEMGCPRVRVALTPEKYAEGIRKRKRNFEALAAANAIATATAQAKENTVV